MRFMKRWMWHMRELRARRVDTVYRCVFGIARECVIVRAVPRFGWPWIDLECMVAIMEDFRRLHSTATRFCVFSSTRTTLHTQAYTVLLPRLRSTAIAVYRFAQKKPPTSAAQSGSPQRLRSSPAIASSTWMLTIGLARMHSPPSSVLTNVWWFSAQSESAHTRGGTGTALVASG